MKKFIVGLIILAISMASKAQSENTPAKTQLQIMDEFNSKSNVSLKFYPNPAVNFLTVEPELHSVAGYIEVIDVLGNVKAHIHLEAGFNALNIDLTQFEAGLYVLTYYDENNRLLHVGRFYKN